MTCTVQPAFSTLCYASRETPTRQPRRERPPCRPRRTPSSFTLSSRTHSVVSEGTVPSPTGLRYDLEKTFPAILVPLRLMRQTADSQDLDTLRTVAPVFLGCLNAIVQSLSQLPEEVCFSPKYLLSERGVIFCRAVFTGHLDQIGEFPASMRRDAMDKAMQFLDMTITSLKEFLEVAAYELIQLKPLPSPPVDVDVDEQEGSTESPTSSSPTLPSDHSGHCKASPPPDDAQPGAQPPSPQKAPRRKLSSFFKPMSISRRLRREHLSDKTHGASAESKVDDDTPLDRGYVHVSTNIRNSIAKFPDCIKGLTPDTLPHPEDATEIWKDRNGTAELSSLKALVRYMTSKASDGDVEITDVFFLCFRFFSAPMETYDAFVARYHERMPRGLSRAQAASAALYVKMRIAKLFFLWAELHWRSEEDKDVFPLLSKFALNRLSQDLPLPASSRVIDALHARANGGLNARGLRVERTVAHAQSRSRAEMLACTWEPKHKQAMLRGDFSRVGLLQFNTPAGHYLLALQLTLLLWDKYRSIQPEDAVRYMMERKGEDHNPPTEIGRKVASFMAHEKAMHRWVMDALASAPTPETRVEMTEMFLDIAHICHELRNFSSSCLISLGCDRPTVVPFVKSQKLSARHEKIKATLREFYTGGGNHLRAYKDALQRCPCAALPGMMLFIGEVARGVGSGAWEAHPKVPGSRLINLRRYRPITWAVRAMEKCHVPFRIQRVDYVCRWLEHSLSRYLQGTETEWENRIYAKCPRPEKDARP